MNPETAKTKITQLLDLGTLQGVKVEYDDDFGRMFYRTVGGSVVYTAKCNRRDMEQALNNSSSLHSLEVKREGIFDGAIRIIPIPLQPKLLEVGDRVKVIGGRYKGSSFEIMSVDKDESSYHGFVNSNYRDIAIYNVVPESLLVEEEEANEMARIVNSYFLDSDYQGKDWEAVRISLIEKLNSHVQGKQAIK